MAIGLTPTESRSASLPIPITRERPSSSVQVPITPPLSPSSSSYPPTTHHNVHAFLYSLLTPPLFSLKSTKRRPPNPRHRQHALLCPDIPFEEAMELEWAWQPDYCCGRNRPGGSFDVLGDEMGEESVSEDAFEGDNEEDMTTDDQCTLCKSVSQESVAMDSRLPRGSIRWLRHKVPEHTLRHIESLLKHLHATNDTDGIDAETRDDDRIGVLHLPSPFHRAILHAVCRWWGAGSRSEYRRGVREDGNHVVIDEERGAALLDEKGKTDEPFHRVTVIRRGRMPTVLLADRVFNHALGERKGRGEG